MVGSAMVTLPLPRSDGGTPIGLRLQGNRRDDQRLLALADALHSQLS